jgi:outer membrane protein
MARRRMAELEATQARIEREVALERLRIADRSLEQAREALRLVQRRYDGGLAAITELLDAAAARTAADLATVAARHDALVALAAERVALGLDLTPLLALDR